MPPAQSQPIAPNNFCSGADTRTSTQSAMYIEKKKPTKLRVLAGFFYIGRTPRAVGRTRVFSRQTDPHLGAVRRRSQEARTPRAGPAPRSRPRAEPGMLPRTGGSPRPAPRRGGATDTRYRPPRHGTAPAPLHPLPRAAARR